MLGFETFKFCVETHGTNVCLFVSRVFNFLIPCLLIHLAVIHWLIVLMHYFQAITGDVIASRIQRSRNLLEQSLGQIQTMVPVMLAAEVCQILSVLKLSYLPFFSFF